MTDTGERLDRVEGRLDKVEPGRVGKLEQDVQRLLVLAEENSHELKLIAEVQMHHGKVLDTLVEDIAPLKALPDLLRTVVENHERRITALEQRGTL